MEDINLTIENIRNNTSIGKEGKGTGLTNSIPISIPQPKQKFESFSEDRPEMRYKTLDSGEKISMYKSYIPGTDNNERLAQNQSGWEQTINGLGKAQANIGSVILGNTVGFVYGLTDWAKTGNFNSVFDNSFSKTLDDWNTKLNYQLPNYYTKDQQKAGFLESATSANFWANDVANGLSFTLGTIASEAIWAYATGGTSLAVRAGSLGARLGQVGRGAEAFATGVRAGETLAGAGKFGKAILGAEKTAEGLANYKGFVYQALDNAVTTGKLSKTTANVLAKTGEVLNTTRFIATSSGNEAGIEAFHFKKEALENFYNDFEKLNGRQPTAEETADITEKIEGAANNVFASNMAILGVSNLAMLGNLFKLKSPISTLQKSVNQKLFGIGVKQVAGETGELVFKGIERKAWQKGAGLLYKATSPIAREGLFEEGLQGATTKTANNWIERQYDPKYLNKVMSLSDDAWKAMGEQYGTKAGWKEIGIGGIVGILGGVGTGEFSQFSDMAKEQDLIVAKGLNAANVTMKTFVSDINAGRMMTMTKVMEAEDRAEQAMTKRDVVGAKLAHNDSMIALAEMYNNPLYGTGGLEQMERHGYNMIDTTEATDQEKQELKAGFKEFIGEYKSANNFANSIVGNQGRIYGTDFQASDVQKALTYTILQGQSSKKMMDESLNSLQGYMNSELIDAVKRNDDLGALGADKKRQVKNLSQQYRNWEKKSEQVQKAVQVLQAAPNEVEGNKQSRLVEMQQKLIEIENKKTEIRTELEGIGREIAQNKKMQQSFGQDVSNIPMTEDFIAVEDLLNLESKIDELEKSYGLLKEINPASAQTVKENMDNYKKAQKALLDHNSAIKLIASGKFQPKLADTNPFSGIYKKFAKGEEKADEHTSQFLTRLNEIRNSFKVAVAGEGQEKSIESYQKAIDEIKSKETLTEEDTAKITELEAKIQALQPPVEEVKDDTPSRESKNKQKVEELTSRIKALEDELKNTPENITVEGAQSDIEAKKVEIVQTNKPTIQTIGNVTFGTANKQGQTDNNEDAVYVDTQNGIFILADGMGGEGMITHSPAQTSQSVINKLLGKPDKNTTEILYEEYLKNKNITSDEAVAFLNKNGFNIKGVGTSMVSTIINSFKTKGDLTNKKGFRTGATALKAKKVGKNTYKIEKVGDTVYFIVDKKGKVTQSHGLSDVATTQGYVFSVRDGKPYISSPKTDNFTVTLNEEETLVLATDFIETDKAIQDFIDSDFGRNLNFAEFQKNNKSDDSTFITIKYDAELKALEDQTTQTEEATSQEQPNPRIKEIQKEINSLKREINKLSPQAELTAKEALKARIEDILKLFKTSFVGTYDVDEAVKNRPDQKDIERYRELLNQEPTQEFEELKAKLSQWRVYDSLAEYEQSVADLLDLVMQLETEVEQENTVAEPNVEDTFEELKKTATVDILELSVNTNYPVTVKLDAGTGKYSITHMNPSSLLQRMGATNVKINKKDVSFEEVDNQKKQGLIVNFISGGVPMDFTIAERGRISISIKDFKAIPDVKTIESMTSWTYPTLYEQDFEGNWKPIASDFSDPNITGDSNKLKDEDALELFVDVNNEYNQKLLKEYNKSKLDEKQKTKELENQVVIYIRKGGENYGMIKGLTQDNREGILASEIGVKTLREQSAKALKQGNSGVIATTKVKYVQLGNPILNIDGSGRISQIAISELGLKNVVATGFVQDGEITLNKEVKDVRRSFIKKVSEKNKGKKVPIVIIKRGAQMIAFPVQMVKTTVSKIEDLNLILDNVEITDAQKVTAINNLLIENGIAPKEFELTTLDEQKVNTIADRLDKNQEYKTAEQLADKKYKKENLVNDATIALDLENLSVSLPSQKFNIDLENLDYDNLPDLKVEKQAVLEKEAEKEVETPKVISAKKQVNKSKTAIEKEEAVKNNRENLRTSITNTEGKRDIYSRGEKLTELYDGKVIVNKEGAPSKIEIDKNGDFYVVSGMQRVFIADNEAEARRLTNRLYKDGVYKETVDRLTDEEAIAQSKVADVEEIAQTIVEKIKEQPTVQTEEIIVEQKQPQINLVSFETVDFTGTPTTFYRKGNKWGYLNSNGVFDSLIPNAQAQIEQEYQAKKESEKAEKDSQC